MATSHPASFLQERMFRLAPARIDHDVTVLAWHVMGELDDGTLARTVRTLATRHPALRSSLHAVGGRVVQLVHDEPAFPVEPVRLRSVPTPLARRRIAGFAAAAARRPVPLSTAPWGSLLAVDLREGEHVLLWRMGHAGWDAFSANVLLRDFERLYAGTDDAARPAFDIGAWAAAQRRLVPAPAVAAYWSEALATVTAPVPRARTRGYVGVDLRPPPISARDAGHLQAWARSEGATLPAALLALLTRALRAGGGGESRLLAVFDANREHPGLSDAIGCVVNLLLVPIPPVARPSAGSLLRAARDALFGAYDHKLPVERQLEFLPGCRSDGATRPVFADAVLNFHPRGGADATPSRGALVIRTLACAPSRRVEAAGPWFGSRLVLNVAPQPDGALRTWWTYDRGALRATEVRRLAAHFGELVRVAPERAAR